MFTTKLINKKAAFLVLPLILVAMGALLWFQDSPYTEQRVFRYSFTISNTSNKFIKEGEFSTYAPLAETSTQKVALLSATSPYRVLTDEYGNQKLVFKLTNIPPYGSKVVSIQADMNMTNKPVKVSESSKNIERYLSAERFVETEHPDITNLSSQIVKTGRNDIEGIYKWVERNIKDSGYNKEDRGALYALNNRKGDCTEYTYLFTALARAADIPTRNIGGFVYSSSAVFDPSDYHNWAQVYENKRWKNVDPQKKTFGDKGTDYIAMRVIVPGKGMESHGLVHVSEGLKVSMNSKI